MREETGYIVENLRPFYICDNPNRKNDIDRQNVKFTFLADIKSESFIKNEETVEIKWFDLDNLPPDEEIAFDFTNDINLYKKYLKQNFSLPIFS